MLDGLQSITTLAGIAALQERALFPFVDARGRGSRCILPGRTETGFDIALLTAGTGIRERRNPLLTILPFIQTAVAAHTGDIGREGVGNVLDGQDARDNEENPECQEGHPAGNGEGEHGKRGKE